MRRTNLYWLIIIVFYIAGIHVPAALSKSMDVHNLVEISELNEIIPEYGTYTIEGYVAKLYECPICPEGAMCKPCMPPNIIISDRKSIFAQYALTDSELIVFTDQEQMEDLKVNKRYRFVVQIMDVKTTDQVLNNVKLIYAERL